MLYQIIIWGVVSLSLALGVLAYHFERVPGVALVATCLAILVALFKDELWAWLNRPQLTISIDVKSPDCRKGKLPRVSHGAVIDTADCYWFRMRVKNTGKSRAELVEVYAAELSRRDEDGRFRNVDTFSPQTLKWAYLWHKLDINAIHISPDADRYCDLGHIVAPSDGGVIPPEERQCGTPGETLFLLDLLRIDSEGTSHIITPGQYELVLLVSAANTRESVRKTVKINLVGSWSNDKNEMTSEGIKIEVVC